MFAAWCDAEQTTVLLSEERIDRIEIVVDHTLVTFRCWCGAEGVHRIARLVPAPQAHRCEPTG